MEAAKRLDGSEISKGIVGGTLSLTISTLIVKFLGLIYKIPLASILGDLGMGYFNSAYTVFSFFYLLCTAGVPKAIMILISESKGENTSLNEDKILRVSTKLFLILGISFTLVFMIFSLPLAIIIGNKKSCFAMLLVAPSIIFVAVSGVIRGFLNAKLRLLDIAASQVIEGVGKLVFGLLFAGLGRRLNMSLEMLSAMTILGVTAGAMAGCIHLIVCSKIKISGEITGQRVLKEEKRAITARIFSISIPITISAAIMSITGVIDLALIMRNLEKIGYSEAYASSLYGNYTTLAVPMFNLALSLITPVAISHLPLFAKAFGASDLEALASAEKSSLQISAVMSAPMMIGLMIFGQEILDLLFPNSETLVGAQLLFALAPAILLSSLVMMVNTVLEAAGKVRAPMISMLFGCVAKTIVSSILITKSGLGIIGAPLGTVICYGTALAISLMIYRKNIGHSLPIISSHILPYIAALISVLTAKYLYLRLIYIVENSILLLASILIAGVIYIGLLAFVALMSPKSSIKMAIYTKKRV